MKHILLTSGFTLIFSVIIGQASIGVSLENLDQGLTWPWNWDIDSNGTILAAANENGYLYIKTDNAWERFDLDPGNNNIEPRGIEIADDGTIWITTTEDGLWSFSNNVFQNYNTTNSSIPTNNLRSLAISENILWIGTDGEGLFRYNLDTGVADYFEESQSIDLKSNFNLDPCFDPLGNIWVNNRECLSIISPDLQWNSFEIGEVLPGSRVKDLHIVTESDIWIAVDGGLIHYDGIDYNVVLENYLHDYSQVYKHSNGDVWAFRRSNITGDGMTVVRDNESYFFPEEEFTELPSQAFELIEHQDTIYAVGTLGNAVAKMTFDILSSTDGNSIPSLSIYPNPTSNIINIKEDIDLEINEWELIKANGSVVLIGKSNPKTIDITNINPGNYLLKLNTIKGLVTKRIIIQK